MAIIYCGDCEELCGKEIEIEEHDCREHMRRHRGTFTETHGLECGPYEQWTEEWRECSICGEREEDIGDGNKEEEAR